MIRIQTQFYPEQDISFMDYFLELSDEKNHGAFIVHHDKLIEYGIATSTRSNDISKRIESLGLSENEHYLLRDISQNSKTTGRPAKVYMLTPEAFKLALMRARRYANQSIDVTKYAKYYLFLEQVVSYYMKYQLKLEQLASRTKDSTIGTLEESISHVSFV